MVRVDGGEIVVSIEKMVNDMMHEGSIMYDFPKLVVTVGGDVYHLQKIGARYDASTENGKMRSEGSFSIWNLELPQGEKFDAWRSDVQSGVHLKSTVAGLDVEGLDELMEEVRKMQEAQTKGDFAEVMKQTQAYMEKAITMVQPGLSFGFEANLGADVFDLNLDLAYAGSGDLMGAKTVGEVVSSFDGGLGVKVDKKILTEEMAGLFLEGPIKQGYVIDNPANYESAIKLDGENLEINGKASSVPELLGPMSELPTEWGTPMPTT